MEITHDEINRKMAEVMGWEYDPLGGILDDTKHPAWIMEDSSWIREEDWNPAERIEQAMMGLEKFEEWRVWKSNGKYACNASFGYKSMVADTAPLAISLAVIEAGK